jgi:1-pyrroline-5-carboxylate dehydrogenase
LTPVDHILIGISQVYVYDDADFDKTLDLINTTSEYALTGAMYVSGSSSLCAQLISFHLLALPPSVRP